MASLSVLVQVGNALIVIEEYDKLDCPTRAMFRQLFENLHTANITASRSASAPCVAKALSNAKQPLPCSSTVKYIVKVVMLMSH